MSKYFKVGSELKPYLTCQDHTVSRETFSLQLDDSNGMLFTVPQPNEKELPGYYESDAYISHTDSKKSLMDRVYQLIKTYSIRKKLAMIDTMTSSKGEVLDIGCGTGDFLLECYRDGWSTTGIEPNQKARDLAVEKIGKNEFLFKDIDEVLNNGTGRFDVITMWHVLEHVPNLYSYIEKLKQLLKPDGLLVIAVPNYESYDAKHYKEFWAAYDVPRHLWHFSQNSIKSIFGEFEFKLIKTLPLIFDSFYVSLLSEKYKTGKTKLISALRIGYLSNRKARGDNQYSSLIYLLKKDN